MFRPPQSHSEQQAALQLDARAHPQQANIRACCEEASGEIGGYGQVRARQTSVASQRHPSRDRNQITCKACKKYCVFSQMFKYIDEDLDL